MEEPKNWLNQGDVFRSLRFFELRDNERGAVRGVEGETMALLVTDNCVLDKRAGSMPKVKRLHFARVHSFEEARMGADYESRVRNGDLNPAEAVYVPLDEGEHVAIVSEVIYLPSSYFMLEGITDPDASGDNYRVRPTQNDSRLATMEPRERRLLQEKLSFFWVRAELTPVCAQCWESVEERSDGWRHLGTSDGHEVVHTERMQTRSSEAAAS